MTASDEASPRRYFLVGALMVIGAALFTYGLHHYGVLDRWENDNLDRFVRAKDPQQSDRIVLVTIDDDDYKSPSFHGQSPLAQSGVTELLAKISEAGPSVIGVDLDTSHWVAEGQGALDDIRVPIVWARDAWRQDATDYAGKVRGRDDVSGLCTGVPAIKVDTDGIVRRAYPAWKVGAERLPSFPSMIALVHDKGATVCNAHAPEDAGHHDEAINFLSRGYGFKRFTARAVLSLASSADWKNDPDFQNRIVLLGGTYRVARDQYVTPVGLMDGVEVVAHITQNEISRDPVRVAGHLTHFLAEIAVGFTLLAVLYFVPEGWKLAVLGGTVLIAIAASLLLFRTSAYFFSFIPVLAGLRIHHMVEHFLEHRQLKRKNESLQARLRMLEGADYEGSVDRPRSVKAQVSDPRDVETLPPT